MVHLKSTPANSCSLLQRWMASQCQKTCHWGAALLVRMQVMRGSLLHIKVMVWRFHIEQNLIIESCGLKASIIAPTEFGRSLGKWPAGIASVADRDFCVGHPPQQVYPLFCCTLLFIPICLKNTFADSNNNIQLFVNIKKNVPNACHNPKWKKIAL